MLSVPTHEKVLKPCFTFRKLAMEPALNTAIPNTIKHWAEDDRPREKLQRKGPSALSDAELLAILINSGSGEDSALDVARNILALGHGNLHELGRLSLKELQKVNGIGEARAIVIAAALELGRRRQIASAPERAQIKSAADAAEILIPLLRDETEERFMVLFLNQANRVICHEAVSWGGYTSTVADIRVILKKALLHGAGKLVVAHNHPSGNPSPSAADRDLTRKLKESAALMDIQILDHLIVAGAGYTSFADEGIL